MTLTSNLIFNSIISVVSIDQQYKKAIASAEKLYLIKSLGLQTLNSALVVQFVNRNTDKTKTTLGIVQDRHQSNRELVWALNEYKMFVWISVCYAYTQAKEFQQFVRFFVTQDIQDFEALQTIFPRKPLQLLEYHLKNLLKEFKNVREKWIENEDQLLAEIVKQQTRQRMKDTDCIRWSEIAYKLFEYSEKQFFRTAQRCRERWFNYLAPEVNRNKWTDLEDLQLIKSIIRYGTKWAMISKLFNGTRTEHMVKNRYNALVKQYQCRSQRTSKKKLEEKFFNAVNHKIAKSQGEFKKDYKGEIMDEQSIEFSETKERKEAGYSKQPILKEDKCVDTLDFEEILLNQNIHTINEIKSIQMEMFLPSFTYQDFQIFV